jgi:tetratricopeptide (TPR) repeat protein
MTEPLATDASFRILPTPFAGIFSERKSNTVGFGATKKRKISKTLWFVERDADGKTTIRPVNKNLIPTGSSKPISPETVLEKYSPEPDLYMTHTAPRMRQLEQTVDEGDEHRDKGELYSAEFQYTNALEIDEDHIRANFGIGLTYLERGENKKAQAVLDKLVTLDAAFTEQHKHLFNEFGIRLRRNGMFKECIRYYKRAQELTGEDDHLLFNIARAHFEAEEFDQAMKLLKESLSINPELYEARMLRKALHKAKPSLRDGGAIKITGI